jgi:copper(I)-binding protein
MEQQREVDIPANTTVQFRPGRYQLTLAGLSRQLRPNTTVPLELRFERAGRVDVTMKVVNKLLGN